MIRRILQELLGRQHSIVLVIYGNKKNLEYIKKNYALYFSLKLLMIVATGDSGHTSVHSFLCPASGISIL